MLKAKYISVRQVGYAALVLMVMMLEGCSSFYVDSLMKEIPPSQFQHTKSKHSIQVLFEFQTNGTSNSLATEELKQNVIEQIETSGLFSTVSENPVSGGALLGITLNNVAPQDEAFSKGFTTGLTFGLAGSQVTDGYVCTATYSHDVGVKPIVVRARHAIHTTVGASSAPENAVKAASLKEAVNTMLKQIISNVLNDLSQDAAFK